MKLSELLRGLTEQEETRTILLDLSGKSPDEVSRIQGEIEGFGRLLGLSVRATVADKELEIAYDPRAEAKLTAKLSRMGLEFVTVEARVSEQERRDPWFWIGWCGSALKEAAEGVEDAVENLQKAVLKEDWYAVGEIIDDLRAIARIARRAHERMEKGTAVAPAGGGGLFHGTARATLLGRPSLSSLAASVSQAHDPHP